MKEFISIVSSTAILLLKELLRKTIAGGEINNEGKLYYTEGDLIINNYGNQEINPN